MQHPNQGSEEVHTPGTAPEVEPEAMKDIDTPAASEGATPSEETDEVQSASALSEETTTDGSSQEDTEPQAEEKESGTQSPGKFKRFFRGYWRHKRWTIILTFLLVAGVLLAVPRTRYPLLALGIRRSYAVTVVDSKTGTPVSGATVSISGTIMQTDSEGMVHVRSKVGKQNIVITKQYYQTLTGHVFVGLGMHHNTVTEELLATGRQVPVRVVNSLTGTVVENAEIKVLDTEAKTDSKGMATIVLPTSASSYQATIIASGYNNTTSANITVTDRVVASNSFHLVPSGRVYFLSNLSGTIDVVSTNLDGSARQTVLAGTGSEDPNNTQLSNTADWNYLALISRREAGPTPKLYSINTATNQSTMIDGTGSSYQIVGWVGHKLIYEVTSATVSPWQNGQVLLRAYDADSGKTLTLDQSAAIGSASDYAEQTFGYTAQIVQGMIIYAKSWDTSDPTLYNGQSDQIISIKPDGSDKQVLKNISLAPTSGYDAIDVIVYLPQILYIAVQNNAGTTYYVYQNGTITQSNTITSQTFYTGYPTYYISPSGGHAAWSTVRDSENTILVGDASGANGQSVLTLSKYTVYGWFSDSYILLSQNPNTLYIMPAGGGTVTKIASYF